MSEVALQEFNKVLVLLSLYMLKPRLSICMTVTTMRFNEDKTIEKLKEYIEGTYNQHYVGNGGIQTFDVWETLGISQEMCQGTAIKYLMRLGRKEGYNEKDLLKAMHYIVLLMHYIDEDKDGN